MNIVEIYYFVNDFVKKNSKIIKNDCLKGKLFADKGYVSQELLELLFLNDIQLVTGMKRKYEKYCNEFNR